MSERPSREISASGVGGCRLKLLHFLGCSVLLLTSTQTARAQLELSLHGIVDLDPQIPSVGGADYDKRTGTLWVSDASLQTNNVFEIDPGTGSVLRAFGAEVIPGLTKGPDGLALHPQTGHLFLFSPFSEDAAGETTLEPRLVRSFPSSRGIAAASFDSSGALYVLDNRTGSLSRWNQLTGELESTVDLDGDDGRISAASFDPITDNLFAFADDDEDLLEIDPQTGAVLSRTDVGAFMTQNTFPTGLAFDPTGCRIYIIRGNPDPDMVILGRNADVSRGGSVNAGVGTTKNVLYLNGDPGQGPERTVEYSVRESFELRMLAPPSLPAGEVAPFAVYLWLEEPGECSGRSLPFGIGISALPMPMNGDDEPRPTVIWNNAGRHQRLGIPIRPSRPAPSVFARRPSGTLRAVRFFVQGVIYDPGSDGTVPASVTNGIWGIPRF